MEEFNKVYLSNILPRGAGAEKKFRNFVKKLAKETRVYISNSHICYNLIKYPKSLKQDHDLTNKIEIFNTNQWKPAVYIKK